MVMCFGGLVGLFYREGSSLSFAVSKFRTKATVNSLLIIQGEEKHFSILKALS